MFFEPLRRFGLLTFGAYTRGNKRGNYLAVHQYFIACSDNQKPQETVKFHGVSIWLRGQD